MKTFAHLLIFFATAFCAVAETAGLEKFSPHFSTNTPIIWQAPATNLPASFWIYRHLPPRPFPASVVTAAMTLGSLQNKAAPVPSTKDFYIAADHPPNYPCAIPVIFSLSPGAGSVSYYDPHPSTNTTGIPADAVLLQRARDCAADLGVDLTQTTLRNPISYFNHDSSGEDIPDQLSGRGFTFSRRLDGILFNDITDEGSQGGFWISFGANGRIRNFSLVWPGLERQRLEPAATPAQIIACIRAFQTMPTPLRHETNFLARIKTIATAKKLTITKITPCYGDSTYGAVPVNDDPPTMIAPFAEMEAIADFGDRRETVRLLTPVTAADATRLLSNK